jgi:hypothetical protein
MASRVGGGIASAILAGWVQLLATPPAAAQAAFVMNVAETPLLLIQQQGGWWIQYETGMALERFDGSNWVELVRPNGQHAVIKRGDCWKIPNRSLAGRYRLRPKVYDLAQGGVAVPINCAAPLPYFAAPACPLVNTVSPPQGTLQCPLVYYELADPGPTLPPPVGGRPGVPKLIP